MLHVINHANHVQIHPLNVNNVMMDTLFQMEDASNHVIKECILILFLSLVFHVH